MQTIVNTARADFSVGRTKKYAVSNNCRLDILTQNNFFQGEIICHPNCRRWHISVADKTSGKVVFSLCGRKNRGFCFEPEASFAYKLIFTADKNSTLHLYNTPDCITDIMYSDNI